jgi:hypothetical protein
MKSFAQMQFTGIKLPDNKAIYEQGQETKVRQKSTLWKNYSKVL